MAEPPRPPTETLETDVAIIGAGPVGLFAVFELGMLDIRAVVLDSLDAIGGQLTALYPEKPIYDIPGLPDVRADELVARLEAQAAPFAPVYCLGQQVTRLEPVADDGRWRLQTSGGTQIVCRAVILAAGSGAFGPNRPPLAGIERFEGAPDGTGVHYLVGQRELFRGKRLVIAGGGDSAVDWALSLSEVASRIYVVHRRPKFRAAPESVARMQALAEQDGQVELVVPYQLDALEPAGTESESEERKLAAVVVRTLEGETRRLEADALLAFFGLTASLGPIADWDLALDRQQLRVAQETCETNRPGIFAIGDVAHYPGKLKLILTGFAEAAAAAHAIRPLIHPEQELHWEYSTTKGLPSSETG